MPQNGLRSCETILLLVLQHPAGTLGLPIDLLRRDDLPARATALNVFAALFTILMLVIISVWLIFRFVRQTLANVSATVTGSTTSSSATSTSESCVPLFPHPCGENADLFAAIMCGGRPRTVLWSTRKAGG
jgi:hypothetical protein